MTRRTPAPRATPSRIPRTRRGSIRPRRDRFGDITFEARRDREGRALVHFSLDIFCLPINSAVVPVRILPEVFREIERLPIPIHRRVLGVLERLEHWPRISGAKRLRGPLAGHYRMRTGDYRVQFYRNGADVVIEKVGHRDGFYE